MQSLPSKMGNARVLSESNIVADYIKGLVSEQKKILIDDASAYDVVVHIGNLKGLILPHEKTFVTVVENPKVAAKYILIAKTLNPTHNLTVLNSYNLNLMQTNKNLHTLLMFETNNWAVYQVE